MSRPWILVCPSSRGIGHALTRTLLKTTTAPILATTRSTNTSNLKDDILSSVQQQQSSSSSSSSSSSDEDLSKRLNIVTADVTDESTLTSASQRAAELFPTDKNHLHLGFAIPGVLHPEKNPKQVDAENALETYRVNTLGPLLLMKHFGEFLPRKATKFAEQEGDKLPPYAVWLTMSARVGSITDNKKGGWYSYRSSKAAVNSLTKSFDIQYQTRSGDKAMAVAYHPGTVKTGLSEGFWQGIQAEGGQLFDPEEAVEKLLGVWVGGADGKGPKIGLDGRGKCFDWKGEEVPP